MFMKKTKKALQKIAVLPRITQKTFIITALLAYVSNVLFWTVLWASVYPNGGRMSQFAVLAVGEVALPILFFGIAYFLNAHEPSRLARVFKASVLASMGLLLQVFIGFINWWLVYSPSSTAHNEFLSSYWFMIMTAVIVLAIFTALAVWTRTRQKYNPQSFRTIFLGLAGGAYIITVLLQLQDTVPRLLKGQDALMLLSQQAFTGFVILPIVLFGIAYSILRFARRRADHVYVAAIYTLIGFMIHNIIQSLVMVGWRSGTIASSFQSVDYSAAIPWITLVFYTIVLIWHHRKTK